MAGLIKNDESEPVAEAAMVNGGDPKDPFLGDSQRFTWARELELGQLQAEVTEALGPQVRLAVFFSYDGTGAQVPVGDRSPVTVYVTPSSADVAAVRQVMGAHKPDRYYGMSGEERAQAQLREKISSGQELSSREVQQALRMLIAG